MGALCSRECAILPAISPDGCPASLIININKCKLRVGAQGMWRSASVGCSWAQLGCCRHHPELGMSWSQLVHRQHFEFWVLPSGLREQKGPVGAMASSLVDASVRSELHVALCRYLNLSLAGDSFPPQQRQFVCHRFRLITSAGLWSGG